VGILWSGSYLRDAAASELRRGFQGSGRAFQMKQGISVFRLKYRPVEAETRCLRAPSRIHARTLSTPEILMKIYRLITLVAAVLITVLVARLFIDEKVGVLAAEAATAEAPR
jgi:hypothetical protein